MNYHNITKDNMLNGDGLRVVLWVSGCEIGCRGCQNPQTHDINSGIPFDEQVKNELLQELNKPYISGITLTGGHPLHENNLNEINILINEIKEKYPNKTIWMYTGYKWEDLKANPLRFSIVSKCDVLVDGPYIEKLRDANCKWRGSTNQRVIDVKKSLQENKIILHCD